MRWDVGIESLGDNFQQLRPIAWSKGFAALEDRNGRARALWISADGRTWTTSRLPVTVGYSAVLALDDRLVLIETHMNTRGSRIVVWSSSDGRHWKRQSEIPAFARTPGYFAGASVIVLRNRLALVGFVGPYSCCGGARPGNAAGRGENGMWIWTSSDGVSWTRQRMRGLGDDSLGFITRGAGGYLGIRAGPRGNSIARSSDGVRWETLGPVPADVDLSSVVEFVASGDGYVLAADTGDTRGGLNGRGPRLTIWQVSRDGVFTEVFDRAGWQVISLASDGAAVVIVGEDYNEHDELRNALALVSTDAGETFTVSAGWPGMAASKCLGPVTIHHHTAVASGACGVRTAPEILVAQLP